MSAFGNLPRSDHLLVRDYVTAADSQQYSLLPEGVVAICLTHSNLTAKHLDIRLDMHLTIAAVKERFRLHIGTPMEHQRLILKDAGRVVCEMSDNNRMLGFYSPVSGNEIHVIDTDPFSLSRNGGLTDTSLVEKYRISDENYDKRTNTIRQYMKDQRKKDPNFKMKPMSTPATAAAAGGAAAGFLPGELTVGGPPPGPESVEGIAVGARCEVMPGARRGCVKFVGESEALKAGFWVGVQFDEPLGRNDGSVKGVRLFECPPGFGGFVLGKNIKCGDFPERDLLDEDEEDEGVGADAAADEDEI